MGQTALSGTRWWRLLRRATLASLALLLLLWFLNAVPARRYVATCGTGVFNRTYIEGPYNEPFLHLLQQMMNMESFYFVRTPYTLYVPYLGLSNDMYDGYEDFSVNVDWKLVASIARGIGFNGVQFPPPKQLVDLIKATEATYGVFYDWSDAGEVAYGSDERFHDSQDACAFMRAAILKEPAASERR